MYQSLDNFYNEIKNKRVAFVGVGVSNTDAILMFAAHGIETIACDRKDEAIMGSLAETLRRSGVSLRLGEGYLEGLNADVIIRSPGVYFNQPELQKLRRNGAVLTSEMELFFDLCPCPVIAVTGSDGKTTTTTLIARMLEWQGRRVHLGGNIGRALLPVVGDIRAEDTAVVELSSFQLISMRRSPEIAVVTNVTPNHLDVHGTMEEYIDAKKHILLHQNAFSRAVLGADNEVSDSFAVLVRGECMKFSLEKPVEHGAYLRKDNMLCSVFHGAETEIIPKDEIKLPGIHNAANYLAAICAVQGRAEVKSICAVARAFSGVEHRIELVREKDGIRWYNDSIATSPTRAIAGLHSFDQKIIMIAGGYDKKIPFDPLAPELIKHVKILILTGATAPKIDAALTSCDGYQGSPKVVHAENIPAAVKKAAHMAEEGDIVTLSPACASFDSYPNFEARGRHFKELVEAL